MRKKKTFSTTVGETTITASFTDIAENTNGSVLIEADNTVVFVTVVMADSEKEMDYFPLSVEFEERFYSVGAILGSKFLRREGRPSQEATLNARIIDRTIRPLFPKGFRREVQVIATVLSFGTINPDVLALLGASLALGTSDIPWNGPVSAVRYTQTNGSWKPFASFETVKNETDHLLLCGKERCITMLEMEGCEVGESSISSVSREAMDTINQLQEFQRTIITELGKRKVDFSAEDIHPSIKNLLDEDALKSMKDDIFTNKKRLDVVKQEWLDRISAINEADGSSASAESHLETVLDDIIHEEAMQNRRRVDGRGVDEVRPLYAQAGGVSSRLHGSGTFYRGGTRVFTALTLGSPGDALALNTVEDPDSEERFMHHYNFPPFSTGETGRVGTPKRREIGHGALAEKALRNVLPPQGEFPYTIRLVSECFSSNGSTSMASVCASTLALMDGGVPITNPVAGIAIGLMSRGDEYVLLTDIQGPEDHHGDMDFKIAGTKNGITAMQLDVKIEGITLLMLDAILEAGRVARLTVLETIGGSITEPRTELSAHAPHIQTLTIDTDTIGLVIGPGGKTIKALRASTEVASIDIEDDGTVTVSGSKDSVAAAAKQIRDMVRSFEPGDTLDGVIKTITDFGAFVELGPNKDGMVHISEFAPSRITTIESIASVGDTVPVVVKEIRPDGRISLSIKERDPTFFDEKLKNQPQVSPEKRPTSARKPTRPSDRRRRPRNQY